MNKKRLALGILTLVLIVLFLKYSDSVMGTLADLTGIIKPLAIGCAIAYILNILVTRIERLPFFREPGAPLYRVRRPISILCSIGLIIAAIALIILLVIPQLADAIGVLVKEIPSAVSQFIAWLSAHDQDWPQLQKFLNSLDMDWPHLLQQAAARITSGLSDIFSSTIYILGSIGSLIINFVVAVIFSIYILAGRERLFHQFQTLAKTYLQEKWYHRLDVVISTAHDTFTRFIIGQCTEAVILGALCTIGMSIFRFPYASMIGTLIGATALLPVVGAYLGAFVGAFMISTVNPIQALGFLVFIVVLQQLEGNLIYPRVVGSSVGLPGIWVLAAVTIGGGLNGVVGMLLAVPITATVYKLLQRDVRRRQEVSVKEENSTN